MSLTIYLCLLYGVITGHFGMHQHAEARVSPQCVPVSSYRQVVNSDPITLRLVSNTFGIYVGCLGYQFTVTAALESNRTICVSNQKFLLEGALIFLDTIDTSNSSNRVIHPLTELIGGSIASIAYKYNSRVNSYLRFRAPALAHECYYVRKHGCVVQVEFTWRVEKEKYRIMKKNAAPFLIHVSDHVISQQTPVTLYFGVPSRAFDTIHTTHNNRVAAVQTTSCSLVSTLEWHMVNYIHEDTFPSITDIPLLSWTYSFPYSGVYKICANFDNEGWHEVAEVNVFGGNPAYFIMKGIFPGGMGLMRKLYTIEFIGKGLDTRKGRDRAKIVSITNNCKDGVPSGGVPLSDDLGPGDSANTNTADYPIWVTSLGNFRICYQSAKDMQWREIHLFDELPEKIKNFTELLPSSKETPVISTAQRTKTPTIPIYPATKTPTIQTDETKTIPVIPTARVTIPVIPTARVTGITGSYQTAKTRVVPAAKTDETRITPTDEKNKIPEMQAEEPPNVPNTLSNIPSLNTSIKSVGSCTSAPWPPFCRIITSHKSPLLNIYFSTVIIPDYLRLEVSRLLCVPLQTVTIYEEEELPKSDPRNRRFRILLGIDCVVESNIKRGNGDFDLSSEVVCDHKNKLSLLKCLYRDVEYHGPVVDVQVISNNSIAAKKDGYVEQTNDEPIKNTLSTEHHGCIFFFIVIILGTLLVIFMSLTFGFCIYMRRRRTKESAQQSHDEEYGEEYRGWELRCGDIDECELSEGNISEGKSEKKYNQKVCPSVPNASFTDSLRNEAHHDNFSEKEFSDEGDMTSNTEELHEPLDSTLDFVDFVVFVDTKKASE